MSNQKQIRWTLGDGREMVVTVWLQTERMIDSDGHKTTVPCCELEIRGILDGSLVGIGVEAIPHPVIVAKCGPVGIKQAQYDEIQAAIAELELHRG